tara:strand:- start:652 stop:930 length:279 start_codon:yes stop_codon:yes gene_type:complete
MARQLLLKGAEAALPTSAGTGTSLTQATLVRVVNTAAAGTNYLVTLQETAAGTTVGSFTIIGGTSELVEKQPTWTMFAANAAVKGAAVGFTN